MGIGPWFWIAFALTVLTALFGGWGSSGDRKWWWAWGPNLFCLLFMLFLLGLKNFGGPLTGH